MAVRTDYIKATIVCSLLLYVLIIFKMNTRMEIRKRLKQNSQPNRMIYSTVSFNFRYLLLPNISRCSDPAVEYIALVLSRVNNYENRRAIRETWASPWRSQAIQMLPKYWNCSACVKAVPFASSTTSSPPKLLMISVFLEFSFTPASARADCHF
ncbi:hypothetical protein Y032_0307g2030 [Ancylostoma ceylanicum]|uniref:Hexosyltransferase n=1 Tax=Ancylostoma ceylanicum TaxID=53326 RepID=A0A016S349_9BILA|nr:hypothetical protein Y032_0307g2030 [Ancylostoma ceylanicum]